MNYFSCVFLLVVCMLFSPVIGHKRYIITGGPGVGKTTILSLLQKKGFTVVPESFTALLEKYEKAGKNKEFWEKTEQSRLKETLKLQEGAESKVAGRDVIFCDRTLIDSLVYLEVFKEKISLKLRKKITNRLYNEHVFLVDPLPEKYYKQTKFRPESYKFSCEIHEKIKQQYRSLGYVLVKVPFDTPENRIKPILKKIQSHI